MSYGKVARARNISALNYETLIHLSSISLSGDKNSNLLTVNPLTQTGKCFEHLNGENTLESDERAVAVEREKDSEGIYRDILCRSTAKAKKANRVASAAVPSPGDGNRKVAGIGRRGITRK